MNQLARCPPRSSRALSYFAACVVAVVPVAASAQSTAPVAPDVTPAAAPVVASTPASSEPQLGVPAAGAAEVHQRAAQAEAFFAAQNFDGAIAEFGRVYELLPADSERFLLWYNIGQSQERLFRFGEAIASYRRYLDEGGARVTDRADVEATVRALERLLGTVIVVTNVERGEIWVDSHRVGALGAPVRIPGGRHVVQVRSTDHEFAQVEIEVVSGQTVTTVRLQLAARYRGIRPLWFWSGLAATAGIAVTFGAVGSTFLAANAENHRIQSEAEAAFGPGQDGLTEAEKQRVRTLGALADGFLVGTGVVAIGTAVLYAVTNWRTATAPSAAIPTAMVVPGGGVIGLAGRF